MRCEAPVFAGVTEAAAGDVEATDGGNDEDGDERGHDRQYPKIKTLRDHSRVYTNLMIA